MNYGDVIYDQPLHESFSNNIETAHYNTALAITGAIKVDLTINCFKSYDYNIFNKVDGWDGCAYFTKFSSKIPSYIYNLILSIKQSLRHTNLKFNLKIYFESCYWNWNQVKMKFIILTVQLELNNQLACV